MYSPFDGPSNKPLTSEDLERLVERQVSEGYYVEYKRELPNPAKIAKSIASFANTYGGWYIVGVITNKHNVATSVVGFSTTTCHDPTATVRDVVRDHIDPVPLFFPQVVQLSDERLALIVQVPGGQRMPFVNRDGKIYRRTHDSSDPVPETSRHALDQLVERGREADRHFDDFARDRRAFSKAETDSWAKIYLAPYPHGSVDKPNIVTPDEMHAILELSQKQLPILVGDDFSISGNVPLTSAHPSVYSATFRQVAPFQDAFNSLQLELDQHGRAKFFLPLICSSGVNAWDPVQFNSTRVRRVVEQRIIRGQDDTWHHLKRLDIGSLWLSVASLVTLYLDWLGSQSQLVAFRMRLEVEGIWRIVSFCDLDEWAEVVERLGLPVLMAGEVRYPTTSEHERICHKDKFLWVSIVTDLSLALGLSREFVASAIGQVMLHASRQRLS